MSLHAHAAEATPRSTPAGLPIQVAHTAAGLDPPAWSPPVFYKVLEGSIGFTAGDGLDR